MAAHINGSSLWWRRPVISRGAVWRPSCIALPAGSKPRREQMLTTQRAALLLGLISLATPALGRDDGRYANSPLKPWFESLHSGYGQCCSDADGYVVADPDWESDHGHYRVLIDSEWVVVPDEALITEPNKIGRTMVWKHYIDGHPRVRCFMPGSMT